MQQRRFSHTLFNCFLRLLAVISFGCFPGNGLMFKDIFGSPCVVHGLVRGAEGSKLSGDVWRAGDCSTYGYDGRLGAE